MIDPAGVAYPKEQDSVSMTDRTNRRIFEFEIRRCSLKPSRYRWTVRSTDGLFIDYATESYPTSHAAITAGEARAFDLNVRSALGYDP